MFKESAVIRAVAATILLSAAGIAEAGKTDKILWENADAIVDTFHKAGAFQGVVVMAVDGEVVYERAVGHAVVSHRVPNSVQTVFQIASVSKPFTAAAVLLLAEREKLDLQAPLVDVLPNYPNGDRLTLDHLLTHTSGIPNVNSFSEYDQWSTSNHTTEQLVSFFKDKPLEFEPGERYSYSNSNYNLLAHVIEAVSGGSYGDFLHENVFAPLEMTDTAHRGDPGLIVPGLANGYVARGAHDFARAPYLDWSIKTGNGSLYATAHDLIKFDRALRSDGFLKPASLELAYGFDRDRGYGWFPGERHGEQKVHINGRSPGYTAHFERYLETDRTLIILSNVYISTPPPMLNGLTAVLLGKDPELGEFGLDAAGVVLDDFAGRYRFANDWFVPNVTTSVENRGDHLLLRYVDGEAAGYEMIMVPMGGTRFFDRTHGGFFRFERNESDNDWVLVYEFGNEWRAVPVK